MKILKGIAGSVGIVSGKVLYFEKSDANAAITDIDTALEKCLKKTRNLYEKTLEKLGEDKAKIFSAYEMLLDDRMLTEPIRAACEQGVEPIQAVLSVIEPMALILSSKKNGYMRQRADDIRYIGQMLIDALCGTDNTFTFPDNEEKYILAAHELSPVDTMLFEHSRLAGLVTEVGGATSHTVILAKSIGIPAVVGVKSLKEAIDSGIAYLDGYSGEFISETDEKTRKIYDKKINDEIQFSKKLESIKAEDAYTKDKKRIAVGINIGTPSELIGTENEKFDGVGLFRSEFLYSALNEKPTFEKQYEAYKEVIDRAYPDMVTIRTIDIGGDKQLEYFNMAKEENPFLGNRGIRLCLKNEDIFNEQIEAILRAAADKKVKIMLPMITSINEILRTKELIALSEEKLRRANISFCKDISVGIMIETPASAIMADVFAKHCDFFSIGTNDLVQYIMAADRGNSEVENIYNPYHPAVLRMIYNTIQAGVKANIEVSVCGDLAAKTEFTAILLGMGLEKFSVPIPMLRRVKYKIGRISIAEARTLAEKVLKADDENEVKNILEKE